MTTSIFSQAAKYAKLQLAKHFCSEYQPAIRNIGYTWFEQEKGWLEERETKDIEFHKILCVTSIETV